MVAAEDLLSLAVLRDVGGSKPAARRWRHHILQPVPLVSFLCGDAGSKPAARSQEGSGARTPWAAASRRCVSRR